MDGTDFSTTSDTAARHVWQFMKTFFSEEYSRDAVERYGGGSVHHVRTNQEFYVTGESYAGHYIPAIAKYFMVENRAETDKYNLAIQGIAMGNAWVNPAAQFKKNPQMAKNHEILPNFVTTMQDSLYQDSCAHPTSLCTNYAEVRAQDTTFFAKAMSFYEDLETYPHYCQLGMMQCQWTMYMPFLMSGKNPYDVRNECEKSKLCYDMSGLEYFFNSDRVRSRLGIANHVVGETMTKRTWTECESAVHLNMMFDDHLFDFSTPYLPEVMDAGVRVLVYSGDQDFICCRKIPQEKFCGKTIKIASNFMICSNILLKIQIFLDSEFKKFRFR